MTQELDPESIVLGEDYSASLMHHGVRGMKWGVRRSESTGRVQLGAAPRRAHAKRKELVKKLGDQHEINKASRQRVRTSRNAQIDAARKRDSQATAKMKKANERFDAEKKTIGRAEATQNWKKTQSKVQADRGMASQIKSGKETATTILLAAGAVTLVAISAASKAQNL